MTDRVITVRMDEETYNAIKQWGEQDHQSLNSVVIGLVERERFRRRCLAHDAQMRQHTTTNAAAATAEFTATVDSWGPGGWPRLVDSDQT
jgi:hypothetical protein